MSETDGHPTGSGQHAATPTRSPDLVHAAARSGVGRDGHRGQVRGHPGRPGRPPGRGAPAHRGRPRRRQDDARQDPREVARLLGPAHPVHARPAPRRRHRRQRVQPGDRDFEFRPGAVFANIVLGDEINRASPRPSRPSPSAWRSAGHRRRDHLRARLAVHGHGDAEPRRDGGHLPSPRRSATVSWRACRWATPTRAPRWTCSPSTPRRTRSTRSRPSPTPPSSRASSRSCAPSTSRGIGAAVRRRHRQRHLHARRRPPRRLAPGDPAPGARGQASAALDDRDHVLPTTCRRWRPGPRAPPDPHGRRPDRRPHHERRDRHAASRGNGPRDSAGLTMTTLLDRLRQLTRRGRVFLALGASAASWSASLGQRDLLRSAYCSSRCPALAALLVSRTATAWRRRAACARTA